MTTEKKKKNDRDQGSIILVAERARSRLATGFTVILSWRKTLHKKELCAVYVSISNNVNQCTSSTIWLFHSKPTFNAFPSITETPTIKNTMIPVIRCSLKIANAM